MKKDIYKPKAYLFVQKPIIPELEITQEVVDRLQNPEWRSPLNMFGTLSNIDIFTAPVSRKSNLIVAERYDEVKGRHFLKLITTIGVDPSLVEGINIEVERTLKIINEGPFFDSFANMESQARTALVFNLALLTMDLEKAIARTQYGLKVAKGKHTLLKTMNLLDSSRPALEPMVVRSEYKNWKNAPTHSISSPDGMFDAFLGLFNYDDSGVPNYFEICRNVSYYGFQHMLTSREKWFVYERNDSLCFTTERFRASREKVQPSFSNVNRNELTIVEYKEEPDVLADPEIGTILVVPEDYRIYPHWEAKWLIVTDIKNGKYTLSSFEFAYTCGELVAKREPLRGEITLEDIKKWYHVLNAVDDYTVLEYHRKLEREEA